MVENQREGCAQTSTPWSVAVAACRRVNWPVFFQFAAYCAWTVATKGVVLIIYVTLIRDGLIALFDPFAIRLSSLPLLSVLGAFESTRKTDIAFVTAFVVFIAVSWSWDSTLRFYGSGDASRLLKGADDRIERRAFMSYAVALLLIGVDMALMYMAVADAGWGGSAFSFSALLVSVLYGCLLVFVTLKSIQLESELSDAPLFLKEEVR